MQFVRNWSFLIITAFLAAGFLIGMPAGLLFEKSAINGSFYFPAMCFRPSKNFAELLMLLNSDDDLKRLTGYYLYRETGIRDYDFLYERYRYDDIPLIRRTIIWIASEDPDRKKIAEFYGKIFEISSPDMQSVITAAVDKLGLDMYIDFSSKRKIKQK